MQDTIDVPPALDAECLEFTGQAGRLAYYVDGAGPPLLLLHSINAAGSAYEIKPIFDHYRRTRRVYALDLPGFGLSDRSDRRYDIALYVQAVKDMIDHIDGEPNTLDTLALSLASEFLARAAPDCPSIRSLILVTPTGFRAADATRTGATMEPREVRWASTLANRESLGKPLFNLLSRPGLIRYFLRRTWGSRSIDQGLARYAEATTKAAGAWRAPLAFLSGRLFSKDIRQVYGELTQPILLTHGVRGDFTDFTGARWTEERSNWQRQTFNSGALPHFELPDTFFSATDAFLGNL